MSLSIEFSPTDSAIRSITEEHPGILSIAAHPSGFFFYADPTLDPSKRKGMRERFGEPDEAPEQLGTVEEVFEGCDSEDTALRLYAIVAQTFARVVQTSLVMDDVRIIGLAYDFLRDCRIALDGKIPPAE